MKPMNMKSRFLALAGMLAFAILLRWLPLPPNFAPVAALALFSGYTFQNRFAALAFPLIALLISDAFIGFHNLMWATYLGFALIVGLGLFLKDQKGVGTKALGSLAGSLVFFTVTNLAVWAQSGMYPKTQNGLIDCFIAATPFLDNAILGDMLFTAVLFGSWALLESLVPEIRESKELA